MTGCGLSRFSFMPLKPFSLLSLTVNNDTNLTTVKLCLTITRFEILASYQFLESSKNDISIAIVVIVRILL